MVNLIDQVGVLLITLNNQLQANMISQFIGLSHTPFHKERQKRWILHCISKKAHQAAVALASANKMANTFILNPTRSYAGDKLEDLSQIDKAWSLIRAMHQMALIGKALNQVIWQVNMPGAYHHVQTMTIDNPLETHQAWLPFKDPSLAPKTKALDSDLIAETQVLFYSDSKTREEPQEEQPHHPAAQSHAAVPGMTGVAAACSGAAE
eukprot:14383372-Ditylum_brightwellii.AAC.3